MTERICRNCYGPVTRCPACHHHHCDDTECVGMPVACARELEGGL